MMKVREIRGAAVLASALLLGIATTACSPERDGWAEPPRPAAKDPAARWDLARVAGLTRLGALTERQRELLSGQGFFLAPQPEPRKKGPRRFPNKATHLFHVYERNDYLALPSYITVDLAIDSVHAYLDAVMKEVEQRQIVPKLREALAVLVAEAERLRAAAATEAGREAATRTVAFFATALRLLDAPARGDAADLERLRRTIPEEEESSRSAKAGPRHGLAKPRAVPKAARALVERAVKAAQAAVGVESSGILKSKMDLTQFRPRGHYTRNGVLERYFRAMSWLGMASFHASGPEEDAAGLALAARVWLGSRAGREALSRVIEVSTFFAGAPDAADLAAAAKRLERAVPDAAGATADALVEPQRLELFRRALSDLPAPRIQHSATSASSGPVSPQVRAIGRRAFEDSVAMQSLVEPLTQLAAEGRITEAIPRLMGALGSAAVLGADRARDEILALATPRMPRALLERAVAEGRASIGRAPVERWSGDAYHSTLHALRALLDEPPAGAPELLRTRAWSLRAVAAFASGWAELRHDTLLYGEQLGAECDAPEPEPPPCFVEPVPAVYARLAAMVRDFEGRLRRAKMVPPSPRDDDASPGAAYYRPLAEKTKLVLSLLDLLRTTSELELKGKPLDRKRRDRLTQIGGEAEWLLVALLDTDQLSPRDHDMSLVADVFTWRLSRQALEVGNAHPDLVYAIIPGPKGPVLARGAVMSYRELLEPMDKRLTDEEWRARLAAGRGPERPAWLKPLYAEPVPGIKLKGEGVQRCGKQSGATLEL
jgi:hypothetical protein